MNNCATFESLDVLQPGWRDASELLLKKDLVTYALGKNGR